MLYVLGGDIGSGKTLRALEWMAAAVRAGRPVLTNIDLIPYDPATGKGCPFEQYVAKIGCADWPIAAEGPSGIHGFQYFWEYAPREAMIVIDEADIYFDSALSKEQSRETRIYHKQLRKMKHDVVYI